MLLIASTDSFRRKKAPQLSSRTLSINHNNKTTVKFKRSLLHLLGKLKQKAISEIFTNNYLFLKIK
jgi:hypothetical protein